MGSNEEYSGCRVGLDGSGGREVTKTAPDQPGSVGLFNQGYDGNFALVESGSREISMEAGDFAADLKICNTVLLSTPRLACWVIGLSS